MNWKVVAYISKKTSPGEFRRAEYCLPEWIAQQNVKEQRCNSKQGKVELKDKTSSEKEVKTELNLG